MSQIVKIKTNFPIQMGIQIDIYKKISSYNFKRIWRLNILLLGKLSRLLSSISRIFNFRDLDVPGYF